MINNCILTLFYSINFLTFYFYFYFSKIVMPFILRWSMTKIKLIDQYKLQQMLLRKIEKNARKEFHSEAGCCVLCMHVHALTSYLGILFHFVCHIYVCVSYKVYCINAYTSQKIWPQKEQFQLLLSWHRNLEGHSSVGIV